MSFTENGFSFLLLLTCLVEQVFLYNSLMRAEMMKNANPDQHHYRVPESIINCSVPSHSHGLPQTCPWPWAQL